MDFDNIAQLKTMATLPVEPPKREGRGIWGSAWDSLKAQGLRNVASGLEISKPLGAAAAVVAGALVPGSKAAQAAGEEGLRRITSGEAFDFTPTEFSTPVRESAKALEPDPAAATAAEKIVFGLTGPAVNLVGAALAGGPAAFALAAGEQGFSQSEDLRRQGVDLGTRSAVGAVTAGVTGVGGVLPLAGSTVSRTLGLYALGGPGAFVAQQQATRNILERADYGEIAKQFDPLDTTGLLLSALVPAPFAGAALARNVRAGKASPAKAEIAAPRVEPTMGAPMAAQEHVDAAMVHNLTLMRDMRRAEVPEIDHPQVQRLAPERQQQMVDLYTQAGALKPAKIP